jgi:hypothetical protein
MAVNFLTLAHNVRDKQRAIQFCQVLIMSDELGSYNGIANIPNRNCIHPTVNYWKECELWQKANIVNDGERLAIMIDSFMCEFMSIDRWGGNDPHE